MRDRAHIFGRAPPSGMRKITCMHVEKSDERDSRWEQHQGAFRVYFLEEPGPCYSVSIYDLTDATSSEAKTWAEDGAGDHMYSIALVSSNEQGHRGLIWLTAAVLAAKSPCSEGGVLHR